MAKIAYFNCTAKAPHIGCMAVTDAHLRMLLSAGHTIEHVFYTGELKKYGNERSEIYSSMKADIDFISQLENIDAVAINGEGTIHHGSGIDLLVLSDLSIEMGKKVYLVNAVLEAVDGFDDVLNKLDDINVRDKESSDYLDSKRIKHRLIPDSILETRFEDNAFADYSGKIVITDWHRQRDGDIGSMLVEYMKKHEKDVVFMPFKNCFYGINGKWRGTVATISKAKLIITARHHGAYIAGLAGVPMVALPSNTHKIEGLLSMSPAKFAFCNAGDNLEEKAAFALENPEIAKEFHDYLISGRPLETFSVLNSDFPVDNKPSDEKVEKYISDFFADLEGVYYEDEVNASLKSHLARVDKKEKKNKRWKIF